MLLVGSFPFNSFLSGVFCHLGLFALSGQPLLLFCLYPASVSSLAVCAVSLRLQISSSEFAQVAPEKAFGDFAFSVAVLLFVVFSFLG